MNSSIAISATLAWPPFFILDGAHSTNGELPVLYFYYLLRCNLILWNYNLYHLIIYRYCIGIISVTLGCKLFPKRLESVRVGLLTPKQGKAIIENAITFSNCVFSLEPFQWPFLMVYFSVLLGVFLSLAVLPINNLNGLESSSVFRTHDRLQNGAVDEICVMLKIPCWTRRKDMLNPAVVRKGLRG